MTELDYRRRMELTMISRDAWIHAAGAAEKANVALQADNERLRAALRQIVNIAVQKQRGAAAAMQAVADGALWPAHEQSVNREV